MGFFFFKQKTAYEMRISDWSSDVCSSDLDDEAEEFLLEHRKSPCCSGGCSGPAPQRSGFTPRGISQYWPWPTAKSTKTARRAVGMAPARSIPGSNRSMPVKSGRATGRDRVGQYV